MRKMRLYEAQVIIEGKPDHEDVSLRFGSRKGTLTVGQLRKLMEGHEEHESVQPESDGNGAWITDWTKTRIGV
jgi:hypothetical protein